MPPKFLLWSYRPSAGAQTGSWLLAAEVAVGLVTAGEQEPPFSVDVETQEFSFLSTSLTSPAPGCLGVGDALALLSGETVAVERAQRCDNPPSLYTNHFCSPPASSLLNNSEPVINGGAPPLPIRT